MVATDPYYQERQIRAQQEKGLYEAEQIALRRQREEEEKERERKAKEEEEKKKEERRVLSLERLNSIGKESEENSETASISFRISDGRKADRRFLKDKLVSDLYDFAQSLVEADFEIVSGFPHAILDQT